MTPDRAPSPDFTPSPSPTRHSTLPYGDLGFTDGLRMLALAQDFERRMRPPENGLRFSPRPLERLVIESVLTVAGSAPSGANKQPWHFDVLSDRRQIEELIGAESGSFEKWPAHPGTRTAPHLIVVFQKVIPDERGKKYYPLESTGISVGLMLAAVRNCGAHAAIISPRFNLGLRERLGRPGGERLAFLVAVGYPEGTVETPDPDSHSSELNSRLLLRRSVRAFAAAHIERTVLATIIGAANLANEYMPQTRGNPGWELPLEMDQNRKERLRAAVEAEECRFYARTSGTAMGDEIAKFGTNHMKPYLAIAPAVIPVLCRSGNFATRQEAKALTSVATGVLLAGLTTAGIGSLTHTTPGRVVCRALGFSEPIKNLMMIVAGHPAHDCQVPNIQKRSLAENVTWH